MKFSTLFSLAALFCTSAQAEETAKTPIFVVIHADIKPDFTAEGSRLFQHYAEGARKEKGTGMFEVLQQIDRPNHFTLIEEWESREAYDRHVGSGHTVEFRNRLQPMLGSPFDERLHSELE